MIELLKLIFWPLLNQQGQFSVADDDKGGDDSDLDSGADDDDAGESSEDSQKSLDGADDSSEAGDDSADKKENMVPQSRFDEMIAKERSQRESTETKLKQFRTLGEEGYYKLYPDEAPEGFFDKADDKSKVDQYGILVEGGKYDGRTFREVYELDKDAAYELSPRLYAELHNETLFASREAESRRVTEAAASRKAIEDETFNFQDGRAKAVFGKGLNELEDEQRQQIEKSVDDLVTWMEDTDRAHYLLEDAFKIMSESEAKSDIAKSIIANLTASGDARSISANKSSGTAPGYGEFMNMSRDALAAYLDTLDDEEQEKFLKNAPKEFRKKYPSLPYYD